MYGAWTEIHGPSKVQLISIIISHRVISSSFVEKATEIERNHEIRIVINSIFI